MAIRKIIEIGDEILNKNAKHIDEITPALIKILDDMKETLNESGGCGLAAPQVGILKKMFIVNIKKNDNEAFYLEIINPEIIKKEGENIDIEACLSIPGKSGKVKRARKIKVKGLNRKGEEIIIEAEDFPARAIQHEYDHLIGKLYIDEAEEVWTNK
ncbi:MAG: peptide deformylase [Clostridiales Family XIII bacterium]|jgi:peptide deformylase|nr:peptide deformylase [Clostridiales Family XIII bacterium]